jgi:hypothetical protein
VTIPLHSRDIYVDGDKIHRLAPTQETEHKNEDFELQGNANDFQSQSILSVPRVLRNPSVVDLSQEDMKLLLCNNHQPHVVNIFYSPKTPTHGNSTIKRK